MSPTADGARDGWRDSDSESGSRALSALQRHLYIIAQPDAPPHRIHEPQQPIIPARQATLPARDTLGRKRAGSVLEAWKPISGDIQAIPYTQTPRGVSQRGK